MKKIPLSDWRRARLAALVDKFGGKASLGRALGFRDGAYIGHMLNEERPITEKFVAKVHAIRGLSGWFDQTQEHLPEPQEEVDQADGWPFLTISHTDWENTPDRIKGLIEGYAKKLIEQASSRPDAAANPANVWKEAA